MTTTNRSGKTSTRLLAAGLAALALLAYAIGFIQRDGVAVLLGYLASVGTIIYFGILIGGGGVAAHGLLRHFSG